jgi:hypothetical protein
MIDHLSSRTVWRAIFAMACAALFVASHATAEDVPPKLGPDFQVNTYTHDDQGYPDVARFPDGGFVVVWEDSGDSPNGIKGRLFQDSGAPASGEILLVGADTFNSSSPPRVAALPGGGFAVVWGDFHDILLRRFDGEARPLGDPVVVNGVGPGGNAQPDVAADSAGNLAIVWVQFTYPDAPVLLRRYDAAGAPQGDPVKVSQFIMADRASPRVAVNDSGSVLMSWRESRYVQTRRFDGPNGAWGPEAPVDADYPRASPVVLYPEGDGALVVGSGEVSVQRLDASGKPLGALLPIDQATYTSGDPDVAVDASGRAFVVWSQVDASSHLRIYGRLLDRAWQPLGDARPISSVSKLHDQFPAVAAGGGGFTAVWANGELPIWFEPITPPRPQDGRDGDSFGVFAQAFGTPECLADSEVLCLGEGNRFHVKVSWKTPSNDTGTGHADRLTADTGAFWFFSPSNLELMIKVLDGRAVNGHFWVFFGGLSDVEYTITMTDTATGKEKTYHNPPGRLASQADTSAFADAGAAVAASPAAVPAAADTGCSTSGTALCLQSGRFAVEVTFTDPRNAITGQAHAVDITADTGAFWFFDSKNLELMIKVLDGRPVNGHFWVFFGALSDVAYTITVTDTATGAQKTYVNPRGQLASRADTSAFQ